MIRTNILYIWLISLMALVCTEAWGQGGSNYSAIGIGDLIHSGNALYAGLGGTAIAMPNNHGINTKNPAMWSYVEKTRLQVGYQFNQHVNEQGENVLYQNNGTIDGLFMLFKIDSASGAAFSLGIHSYSSARYKIASRSEVVVDDLMADKKTIYSGAGGLSTGYLGLSGRPFSAMDSDIMNRIILGGQLQAAFGSVQKDINTTFNGNYYYESYDYRDDYSLSFGWKIGLGFELFDGFVLGAYYEQFAEDDLTTELVQSSTYVYGDVLDTLESKINLPTSIGVGASYRTGKFLFGVDYSMYDIKNLSLNSTPGTEYRNLQNVSLAVSRLGSERSFATFLDRVTYNFGLGYRQLYYTVLDNPIDEMYFSFGMEIPVIGNAMLDASFVFGTRGTTDDGLVRENFGRMRFDISIGEVWFKPFRR